MAVDFVRPMTPAFAVEYAAANGLPSLPAIDAMLTMRPQPRSSMYGIAAREQ